MLSSLILAFVCISLIKCLEIGLNSVSSVARDIVSVDFNLKDHQVVITLANERRCTHPLFLVRLSGAALYLAELESIDHAKYKYGYPCTVDSGAYYVEVIALYCEQFNSNNYTNYCIEAPTNMQHMVTIPFKVNLEAEPNCEVRPRWVWNNHNPAHNPKLLQTRHQRNISELTNKEHCESGVIPGFCNAAEKDIAQYLQYDWVGAPKWEDLHSLLTNTTHPIIHMCYVGDSHSRELAHMANLLAENKHKLTHVRISSVLPSMFTVSSLSVHKCSVAVISFGQWLFNNKVPPITKERYTREIREVMEQLVPGAYAGPTRIFFRTENFNGLGARYTACPPQDYRSVPAVRMMNDVLRELSAELRFDFIDLTHIQAVHWDGAKDFNHPSGKVITAEVEWILYSVFQTALQKGYNLSSYTVHDEPRNLPKLSTYEENVRLSQALTALSTPL